MRQRTEVRDGVEFTVTTLPQDPRLTPSKARERVYWSRLTRQEKYAFIEQRKAKARAKRRRRRRRKP